MALVITDAGRAASVRAGDLGVEFKISHISIGTEGYTPTEDQTELRAEIIRKPVIRGRIIKTGHLHFEADFVGKEEFEGKEIGYHLDDEAQTLFGVDSDDGKVMTLKRANSIVTEVFDLNLSASRIDNITVEVATMPFADEETPGIAEVATIEEVAAGVDDERIVTAKKLSAALSRNNKPNFIETQDDDIALNKLNVFKVIKPIQLPEASEDCICRVLVLAAVTEENKQPFTAPNRKKITVLSTGEQHETTNIVTRNVQYTFKSIDGEWYV
ncbi:hypothetical protein [Vibrio rotiferianus]|uniref:hypothetical protein n=1 Tax=Vibrio rotiferianus TaxID=190895 RepID=UPI000B598CDD|nr:hypothetical protein [Vibrio rotiferianus]ASI93594.1 hypothetical protein BSZ04_00785 [Vibrio rotiferianus]